MVGEAWTIDPEPFLRIGAVDDIHGVRLRRPTRVSRFPDGRLAVGESELRQIRLFAPDGTPLATIGSRGMDPGQFRSAPAFWLLPGDTILAWDQASRRLSWFDTEGTLLKEEGRPRSSPDEPEVYWDPGPPGGSGQSGIILGYRVLTEGGGWRRYPKPQPAGWDYRKVMSFIDRATGNVVELPDSLPFGRKGVPITWEPGSVVALVGDEPRLVISMDWEWSLSEYGPDGALIRVARAAVPRLSGGAAVDSLRTLFSNDLTLAPLIEADIDSLPAIAFSGPSRIILGDGVWNLWVRRATWNFSLPMRTGTGTIRSRIRSADRFDVLDPERRWLGTVDLPPDIGAVKEIGPDYLLTTWGDPAFRPTEVRVYRILKGSGD